MWCNHLGPKERSMTHHQSHPRQIPCRKVPDVSPPYAGSTSQALSSTTPWASSGHGLHSLVGLTWLKRDCRRRRPEWACTSASDPIRRNTDENRCRHSLSLSGAGGFFWEPSLQILFFPLFSHGGLKPPQKRNEMNHPHHTTPHQLRRRHLLEKSGVTT